MSRLLSIPSEIRLQLYMLCTKDLLPALTVHQSVDGGGDPVNDATVTTTFRFREKVTSTWHTSRTVRPSFLEVCRQIRSEVLQHIAMSITHEVLFMYHYENHVEELPPTNLGLLGTGYASQVRKLQMYGRDKLSLVPLDLFTALETIIMEEEMHQDHQRVWSRKRWTLAATSDERVLVSIRQDATETYNQITALPQIANKRPGLSVEAHLLCGVYSVD